MGLDTSHDCWHGAYSYFGKFRKSVAKTIRIDLDKMEGFQDYSQIDNANFTMPIKWKSLPKDNLHILLNHSDCDGIIAHKDCLKLAKRLNEVIPLIMEEHFKELAEQFVVGLMDAHFMGEDVEFH